MGDGAVTITLVHWRAHRQAGSVMCRTGHPEVNRVGLFSGLLLPAVTDWGFLIDRLWPRTNS